MSRAISFALVSAAVLIVPGSVTRAGAITNGGFETGNLSGWSTIGDTTVKSKYSGTTPPQGDFQAVNLNANTTTTQSQLETFLGIPNGNLDNLSPDNADAVFGSAIKQTFSGTLGEVLSFSWNFETEEKTFVKPYDDFAFWTLTNIHNGEVLASVDSGTFNNYPAATYPYQTGYQTASFTLTKTGTFTLGFGVIDAVGQNNDSNTGNSALFLDNVALTSGVPAPSSWALLVIGAVGLLLGCRRWRGAFAGA